MGLNGCCSCVKYLMVLINILFWIIGLTIVIASAGMITDPTFVLSMTQSYNHYYIALYVFLGIGIIGLTIVIASAGMITDPTFVLSMTQSYNHYYIALYVFLGIGIIGLTIVIASAWMITDPTFVLSMTQSYNHYYIALYVFLGIGVLITLGAFFGCCGVVKESQCLLVSFFCVILIVMVAQIAAGAWAFHNKDKLDDIVRASVKYSVQEEYGQSSMSSRTVTFDTIQKNLHCCGADGPSDWATSRFNNVDRTNIVDIAISSMNVFYNIPESCCRDELKENVCDMSRKLKFGGTINGSIYPQGCVDKLIELIYDNWILLFGITAGVILLELLALTFSLSLCCAVRNQHYKA